MKSRICIVCYDVSDNKTRRNLAKLIAEYGKRIQGSVFLCDIDETRQHEMELRLRSFYMNSRKNSAKPKIQSVFKQRKIKETGKNTLNILLIPFLPWQIDSAMSLGKRIDCIQSYAVIA